jgi:hypothetical protein
MNQGAGGATLSIPYIKLYVNMHHFEVSDIIAQIA